MSYNTYIQQTRFLQRFWGAHRHKHPDKALRTLYAILGCGQKPNQNICDFPGPRAIFEATMHPNWESIDEHAPLSFFFAS